MRIPITLLLSVLGGLLLGQQLPQRSIFDHTNFIWNPGMTAPANHWELGAVHQQEWVGFTDAPRTTSLYAAYPFRKQRFSLGGFFMLDQIKPINNNTLALTYAYHLGPRSRKGERTGWQLSLGLLASMSHLLVDAANFVVRHQGDPLQPTGEYNQFKPNVGFGAYYQSPFLGGSRKQYFFAGLAANQLIPSDVPLGEQSLNPNLRRVFHGNATIGYQGGGENLRLEPSLWVHLAGANITDAQFNLVISRPDAFWAGLHYSLSQTLAIQLGYAMPSGFAEGDALRLGMTGSFSMGDFAAARGLGWGFYLAYRLAAE